MTTSYVALLRGINVGGRNKIRMADLVACFEALGHADVRTYIQSGNVLFESDTTDREALVRDLEAALGATFGYAASLALRSHTEMRRVVDEAPPGFGDPERYRSDVLFLLPPLTAEAVMTDLPLRDGVDEAWPGPGVAYFQRLAAKATQSRLSRVMSLPMYQRMTIRNWNTTRKLLELLG